MNKIFCMVAAILTMGFSLPFSQAETISLSREEAIAMMDAFENLDFDEVWEWKEFQKENARHTKEWEEKFGRNTRWQGDVTASYVLAYGMMPTHDAPFANPLSVLPGPDTLGEAVARSLAMDTVAKVESRLTRDDLETMEYTWEYCFSRDLDWFWDPAGTWIFAWYQEGKRVCMVYVSDSTARVTIVFDYLDRTPDDEGIHIYTDF